MNYFLIFISSFIINAAEIFCIYNIVREKIQFKSIKLYAIYFTMVLLIALNFIYSDNLYKIIITLFLSILEIKLLLNKSLKESVIIAVIMELVTIISELFFSFSVVFFYNFDNQTYIQLYQGQIISNLVISIIIVGVSCLKIQNRIYKKILSIVDSISLNKMFVLLGTIILCSSFLFYISYYNKNNFFSLFVNFMIITVYFIIVIMIIRKENNYNKVYSKYIIADNELKEYERIINEYRIVNHENKNQLLLIKGMTKNKKVNAYIDEIINNKNLYSKSLLNQALLLPTGGLRGLIYSKLVVMKEYNINYMLNIDKKVNNRIIKKISSSEMIDICQIVGVFLDNAIEAVIELKNKQIIINIYVDDCLYIEIINNYTNSMNFNKLDKVGYTTKGTKHGYGLALVSKILNKNKNFSNEREVSKNIFKQKLVIKLFN